MGLDDFDREQFSEWELERAADLRRRVVYAPSFRSDRCPHREPCEDPVLCIRYIAWYLRHQHEIEDALQESA